MGVEIERKFLVKHPQIIGYAEDKQRIRQGYLNLDINRTVRIRMVDDTAAWITVKGLNDGIVRKEYEYRIPEQDGAEMLQMCDGGYIDKTRYIVPAGDFTFEIDQFHGDNDGLIVAELEFELGDPLALLSDEEFRSHLPDWVGEEVSSKSRYYNSVLLTTPYKEWK